mmetsp:Transcript_12554/g.17155  ORF Transcript_12554/g.17155 Transcript_12554/m.17155 type:complete len:156 (-) Transcript_12554:315-782(-)|eukprot:CAMPEP_0196570772 /NCGR_PEP_ID=MMETSP1081-20130531/940_1 /TAXON_ID=36882 /ORGANISM="Pyramimonas amylifera, Strain CCMP720" /LENGTH=155 /DNA_ID=CAMNT_0041887407 /DNA_START=80 /DNA_END=547 /DNA_ORIENTATION=+
MPTANDPMYYTFTKQLVDVAPCILFPINSTEDYHKLLAKQGLKLVEVYSEGWGPCYSILPTLKRIKIERDPDPAAFQYNVCMAEKIEDLEKHAGLSKPLFLFYRNGKLVDTVEGPNTPAIERAIYANTPVNPEADDIEENPFYLANKKSRPGTTK